LVAESEDLSEINRLLKQEIAHRRRAEEANATFAAIVEHSNDGIIGQKLDGTIVTWNNGAQRIFGYTAEEAIGRPISILSPADNSDEPSHIVQAIRRGEVVQHFETAGLRKDGTEIKVSLTVSPIRDSAGKVVGASRIARDITLRKQMEQALREGEARARAILDTAVDAIITIDAQGIVESFNKAAERLFGYSPVEVIGKNVSMLMPEPFRGQHDGYLRSYIETGHARIIGIGREVTAQRKDGTRFPADLAVSEVHLGHRRLFTGIVRDISDRKRLEQEILEISDREKRRIGQDLHDSLGQLLTGIGFKSKSLQNKMSARGLPEAQSAGQIADLVTQAISESRGLARGLQPVAPGPMGLMSALGELATGITDIFKMPCTFRCPDPVTVDDPAVATQLYRIAQEATNNAIRHGKAKSIEIELKREQGALKLTVRDDGIGFPETAPRTSGLGLQIMRYRAGLIGATIVIGRRVSGGTVVTCECAASSPSPRTPGEGRSEGARD
jgi:PAS domain S-box-containing protein